MQKYNIGDKFKNNTFSYIVEIINVSPHEAKGEYHYFTKETCLLNGNVGFRCDSESNLNCLFTKI